MTPPKEKEISSLKAERDRLRDWLIKIKNHNNYIGGSMAVISTIGYMCDQALSGEDIPEKGESEKYNELIMSVELKFQDETRHQTVLRYIEQAEKENDGTSEKRSE